MNCLCACKRGGFAFWFRVRLRRFCTFYLFVAEGLMCEFSGCAGRFWALVWWVRAIYQHLFVSWKQTSLHMRGRDGGCPCRTVSARGQPSFGRLSRAEWTSLLWAILCPPRNPFSWCKLCSECCQMERLQKELKKLEQQIGENMLEPAGILWLLLRLKP